MAGTVTGSLKHRRVAMYVALMRAVMHKYTESTAVARKKQEEYKAKVFEGKTVSTELLESVIAELGLTRYALFGGNAAILFGSRRTTIDIDLLVSRAVAERLEANLRAKSHPMAIGGFTTMIRGFRVDIVHGNESAWFSRALSSASVHKGFRCVTRPWLVVQKLVAMRGDLDIFDAVAAVRGMNAMELVQTRRLVKRYCPNEVEDFENIVEFAKLPVDE